jgi:hypothetical protein
MESELRLNADFKEEYSKGPATKIARILHGSKWEFTSCSAASCRIKSNGGKTRGDQRGGRRFSGGRTTYALWHENAASLHAGAHHAILEAAPTAHERGRCVSVARCTLY